MSQIELPKNDALALNRLAASPLDKLEELFSSLRNLKPGIYVLEEMDDAVRKFALDNDFEPALLGRLVRALNNTRSTLEGMSDADFVKEVVSDISNHAGEGVLIGENLQALIVNLISMKNISLSLKATRLALETDRQITDLSIISDLRPVFSSNPDDIECMFIANTLKIEYGDGVGDTKYLYFSMDEKDLISLEKAIIRARRKMAALSNFASRGNIQLLGVKG